MTMADPYREPTPHNPLQARVDELEEEVRRLQAELAQYKAVVTIGEDGAMTVSMGGGTVHLGKGATLTGNVHLSSGSKKT